MIEVKISGLTELRQTLVRELPEEIRTKALQATLAKAAQPIVSEARARVAVRKGVVRRGIYSFKHRSSTLVKAVRLIAVRSGRRFGAKDAFYWRWIEFGRGVVRVGKKRGERRGGARAASLGNPQVGWFGKEVKAVPARPFLRPAFESRKFEALEVFRRSMAGEISKIATKLHARNLSRLRRSAFRAFTK